MLHAERVSDLSVIMTTLYFLETEMRRGGETLLNLIDRKPLGRGTPIPGSQYAIEVGLWSLVPMTGNTTIETHIRSSSVGILTAILRRKSSAKLVANLKTSGEGVVRVIVLEKVAKARVRKTSIPIEHRMQWTLGSIIDDITLED